MAKSLTIKNKSNLILYPKTVSSLVYNNTTGNTVKYDLDNLIGQVAELLGVENAFFGGIVGSSTDIATDYSNKGYSGTYLYMVGTDMTSLVAYQYTGSGSPTQLFGGTTYDFTDYSDVKQEVAQLGLEMKKTTAVDEDLTWDSGYFNNGSKNIGDAAPNKTSSSSYKCLKIEVKAGDVFDIYARANSYQHTLMTADTNGNILSLSGKDVIINGRVRAENDGWIFVNNMTTNVTPFARLLGDSLAQRVADMKTLTLADKMLPGDVFNVHLDRGAYAYPNTNIGYMAFFANDALAMSQWLNLNKGTYIVSCGKKTTIYQSDAPLRANDRAVLNDNIVQKVITANSSTRIDVVKNYTLVVVLSITDDDNLDTIVQMELASITGVAAPPADYSVPHVSCSNNDFYLSLPLRESCMIVWIRRFGSSMYVLPHYGTADFYLPYDGKWIPSPARSLLRDSEAECAINLTSDTHNGYIGGHMHGYERIVDADTTVYIDGAYKAWNEVWSQDIRTMFELSTHTQLLETDNETVIANVYKRWRVVNRKIHYFNRVVFAKQVHINKAQFSMFGIRRKFEEEYLTNRATRNDDTFVYQTTDGWDTTDRTEGYAALTTTAKATHQEQWGDLGYRVTQDIFESNMRDNGGMFMNTNGGGTYNKMYFEIGSDFDVAAGDVLFSHAILGIE